MLHAKSVTAMFILCAALTGCKSKPEQVCSKIEDLASAAQDGDSEQEKKLAEKMQKDSGECVAKMKELAEEEPEAFDALASCTNDAGDLEAAIKCFFAAAKAAKTKGE